MKFVNKLYILIILPLSIDANEVCDNSHLKICSKLAKKHYKKGEIIQMVKLLKIPCNQNIGVTCGLIGASYRDGVGDLKKDTNKAKYYLKKGCESGYAKVCRDLGRLYQQEQEVEKAIRAYEMGCKIREEGSCYNLGSIYFLGDGIEKDLLKSKKYYLKSCRYGSRDGCLRVKKLMNIKSTNSKVEEKSLKNLVGKCQAKDAIACHNLSVIYYQSFSYKKALEYDKLACVYKYSMGCKNVALSYYNGKHITQNIKKALYYFKVAGSLGDAGSFYNVALIYEKGDGVIKNIKKAREFFIKACLKKDMASCNRLGYFYEKGIGYKKDMNKAKWFYNVSCDNHYAKGCSNMAFLYLQGEGVDKNPLKAKIFFKKACSLGDNQSCNNSKAIKIMQTR